MHRNRQAKAVFFFCFCLLATLASSQISELKVSELPDFTTAINARNHHYGTSKFEPTKAIIIVLQDYFEKRPVTAEFFYSQKIDSQLFRIQKTQLHTKKVMVQLPYEGYYWAKVENEEGTFHLMQYASITEGFAKAVFQKKR